MILCSKMWVQDLGLECANWGPEVFQDLIRHSDGTEEGLVESFFDTVRLPDVTS